MCPGVPQLTFQGLGTATGQFCSKVLGVGGTETKPPLEAEIAPKWSGSSVFSGLFTSAPPCHNTVGESRLGEVGESTGRVESGQLVHSGFQETVFHWQLVLSMASARDLPKNCSIAREMNQENTRHTCE